MFTRLMGPESAAALLRSGLDASSARARGIAHRVANASTPGFAGALNAAQTADPANPANAANAGLPEEGVDVEQEMVSLADEQIRYEALTRLLQQTYTQVRSSVRER